LPSGRKPGAGEVDAGNGMVAVKEVGYDKVGVVGNWGKSGGWCWMSSREGESEAAGGGESDGC
jgi:hypothetical protein